MDSGLTRPSTAYTRAGSWPAPGLANQLDDHRGNGLDKVESVPVVEVPMSQIHDWGTFHDTFAQTLGFPDFYGRNMDAWIDCLTYADEDDSMRAIAAGPGEVLTLQLEDCRELRTRCPEIYQVLIDCAAFVDWRRIEQGGRPVLALSYH